ncbi:hypothetical protein N7451_006458 [Penicillium sp. IBT 35674x]|nr:hypothetical protein N7451_006458 [Penicillium sp. IBT 35674x]
MRRPNKRNNIGKKLERYLRDPLLDINFEFLGISPLAKATAEPRVLDILLQHETIDLNFCNSDGRTSLFFAVQYPQTDSLRLLIDKGALIDQRDNEGRTPLSLAAELGRLDHLKILVESNADINSADGKGWTPLFWAISMCNYKMATYLVSNQDVNKDHQDANGWTPLIIAAETGNAEMIRYLLGAEATMKKRMIGIERNLLIWAIFQRDVATVKLLLKADESLINHRVEGRTPLSMATELGDPEIAELLIKAMADVHASDGQGRTLFSLAAERGFIQIMHLLIENGADPHVPDNEGYTGFWWFLRARHDLYIHSPNHLIRSRHGSIVNPFLLSALIWALPTPNKKDRSGRNWLSWAAEYGDDEVVRYFLQVEDKADRVDINICDGTDDLFSRTPLIWALESGNNALVDLLKDCDTASLHLLIEGISSMGKRECIGIGDDPSSGELQSQPD